ncbi:MAG: hypothetical protein COC22_01180 [Flavobacteriaceae bacterium]|nr:MAG: hypothetical protein COC22_01180 [Flavobacteriaceae bacterium]
MTESSRVWMASGSLPQIPAQLQSPRQERRIRNRASAPRRFAQSLTWSGRPSGAYPNLYGPRAANKESNTEAQRAALATPRAGGHSYPVNHARRDARANVA